MFLTFGRWIKDFYFIFFGTFHKLPFPHKVLLWNFKFFLSFFYATATKNYLKTDEKKIMLRNIRTFFILFFPLTSSNLLNKHFCLHSATSHTHSLDILAPRPRFLRNTKLYIFFILHLLIIKLYNLCTMSI